MGCPEYGKGVVRLDVAYVSGMVKEGELLRDHFVTKITMNI
jgi:hypothetical protein